MKAQSALLAAGLLGIVAMGSIAAEDTPAPGSKSADAPASSLQLSLVALALDQPLAFRLTLENRGATDVMINMGSMLANGKVMWPEAVRLVVQDAGGTQRELLFTDPRYPGVAGRVDDFIVPLRAGSTYSLWLSLKNYWCPRTKEFPPITVPPGEYRVHAILSSEAPRHVNGDMRGMKLMNIWKGNLSSAPITIRIEE
jgi:hypothetical protein